MNLFRSAATVLIGVGLAMMVETGAASPQANRAATPDPLAAYAGTWTGESPGGTPFVVLRLIEVDGKLTGTISHFQVGEVHDGKITWSPASGAEDPIADVRIWDSGISFLWSGDAAFAGGKVKFVAEGTGVADMNIPISADEVSRLYAEHWGLAELSPTIRLRRAEGPAFAEMAQDAARHWQAMFVARLINQAEFQYKFDHGVYAEYPALLSSGQLGRTKGLNWTVVPLDLKSESDPFPGHVIRLVVSAEGTGYGMSITPKAPTDCPFAITTDETGVIHGRDCLAR